MSGLWPGRTRCVVMLTFDFDWVSGTVRRDPEIVDAPGQPVGYAEGQPAVPTGAGGR